jgi:hypothetical protein
MREGNSARPLRQAQPYDGLDCLFTPLAKVPRKVIVLPRPATNLFGVAVRFQITLGLMTRRCAFNSRQTLLALTPSSSAISLVL